MEIQELTEEEMVEIDGGLSQKLVSGKKRK